MKDLRYMHLRHSCIEYELYMQMSFLGKISCALLLEGTLYQSKMGKYVDGEATGELHGPSIATSWRSGLMLKINSPGWDVCISDLPSYHFHPQKSRLNC